jgi:hypothetical protein
MEPFAPPRTLALWEEIQTGDLICESQTAIPSLVIRIGTASDLNHTAIVTDRPVAGQPWDVVEAVGAGVVHHTRPAPHGYVVRVTDDHVLRHAIARAALDMAAQNARYSWFTIIWQAGRVIERVRLLRPLGRLLQHVTKRLAANSSGMICSEVAIEAIRTAVDANPGPAADVVQAALRPLQDTPGWQIAPADVFRALLGRGAWDTPADTPGPATPTAP